MGMDEEPIGVVQRWARFRFSIIGGLLASPPDRGQLRAAIEELASRRYRHPTIPNETIAIGASTIERWLYQARDAPDPMAALARRVRADVGACRALTPDLLRALHDQYQQHTGWSYQLHFDNLAALVDERPDLGPMPSYSTVRRRMQQRGLVRRRSLPRNPTTGQIRAAQRLERREVRSYQAAHVHALWHADYHQGRRRVVSPLGSWHIPVLLAVLDDCCRLCCHAQWYLAETAENHVHGLTQALLKRGLPRQYMTDNGGPMIAHEVRNGLLRLGITHTTILPYSAYQNGKQENFWAQVEGRLMAMLERVDPLTLADLNRATLAWTDLEYNRKVHSELGKSPVDRMLEGPDVGRSAPGGETLRIAFCLQQTRTQRQSDGTVAIEGVRFEIPSRYRHIKRLEIRFRSWDLSVAYLVDGRTGDTLARIYPQDKARNADGRRRALQPIADEPPTGPTPRGSDADPVPPLLRRLLAQQAATGLPPAYLPKYEAQEDDDG